MASNRKGRVSPKDRPFRPAGFMVVERDSRRILRYTRKKRIVKQQYLAERSCYFNDPSAVDIYAVSAALMRDIERFLSVLEPEDWFEVDGWRWYADKAHQAGESDIGAR